MQRKALSIVDIVLGVICALELAVVLGFSVLLSQNSMIAMLMGNALMKASSLLLVLSLYWPIFLPFPATIVLSAILVFGKKSSSVDNTIGLVFLLVAGVPVAICLFAFLFLFFVWLHAF